MSQLLLNNQAEPSSPAAGKVWLYSGTDKFLKYKNEDGTVYSLGPATTSSSGLMSAADKLSFNNDSYSSVNLLDYGGNNNATADNAAALAAALAALPATGGVIYLPYGSYLLGTEFNASKTVRIIGDNFAQSIIVLTDPSANGITFSNWNSGLENIEITGLATTTTGTRAGGETTIPVAELSNFPNSGSLSFGGTAGWVTVTYTGRSATSGAGNFTGCSGVTACGSGANVMIRTGGFAVNMPPVTSSGGNYNYISSCKIYNVYNGMFFASALGYIDTVEIRNVRNNAVEVDGNNDKFINRLTTASAPIMAVSVKVNLTSSLLMQQCQILQGVIGLDLNALTGITIPSIEGINCFFDNCTIGMRMTSTGSGSIYRCKFTNCWFSSGTTAGVQFNTVNCDGINFVNCDFYGNGKGIAADVVGGGNWLVEGCQFAGNTTAIALSASAAHYPKIIGCHIGPQAAFGVNTTGINVGAGTYKGLLIQAGACINNTTNLTLGAVTVGAGEAGFYRIEGVAGINPKGAVTTPAVPASTVTVTNTTGFRLAIYMRAGTITAITVNGVVTGVTAAPSATGTLAFSLDPGGTIAMTYSVIPTWVWVAN